MDIKEIFSKNLKKYRNEQSLSQEKFAEKAHLHRTYISAVESKRRSISLDNIQKIAEALDIEIYKLFIIEDGDKNE